MWMICNTIEMISKNRKNKLFGLHQDVSPVEINLGMERIEILLHLFHSSPKSLVRFDAGTLDRRSSVSLI